MKRTWKNLNKSIFLTLVAGNAMTDYKTSAFVVSSTSSHSYSSQIATASQGTISSTTTTTTSSTFSLEFLAFSLGEPIPTNPTSMQDLKRVHFSKAVPICKRPPLLDGTMPGDVGFDPLRIAKTRQDLENYREVEVKHGRLAMLAALGWPISDYYDDNIANSLDLPNILHQYGNSPTFFLNGVGDINISHWLGVLGFAALVDSYGLHFKSQISDRRRSADPDLYWPGNVGFDPLGLYPKDMISRRVLQLAEIKHGRVAMMAVLIYAIQESMTKFNTFSM